MPTPTEEFFERLSRRGHEPVLEEMDATLRFDLVDAGRTEYWFVEVRKGDVRVSREDRPADCVTHMDRVGFDQMVTGHLQAQPAWLSGKLWVEGNLVLLRMFDRAFPGPPGSRDPRDIVAHDRRRR